jgi:sporulation protein YlmC with PRC-barrel domain
VSSIFYEHKIIVIFAAENGDTLGHINRINLDKSEKINQVAVIKTYDDIFAPILHQSSILDTCIPESTEDIMISQEEVYYIIPYRRDPLIGDPLIGDFWPNPKKFSKIVNFHNKLKW